MVKWLYVEGMRTDFLIDSNQTYQQVLQERDNLTGTLLAHYTYGHDLLAQHNPTYGPAYYHYDAQLSTRFLTDPEANIVNTYEYSAFGPFLSHTTSLPNPFTYTGEYFDPESSLLYLRARYYDLYTGRFLSHDLYEGKMSNPLTRNYYIYGFSNPIRYVDYSGHENLLSALATATIITIISNIAITGLTITSIAIQNVRLDGFIVSGRGMIGFPKGGALSAGIDLIVTKDKKFYYSLSGDIGYSPNSFFRYFRKAGGSLVFGPIFGMNKPNDMSGWSISGYFPLPLFKYVWRRKSGFFKDPNKIWDAMTQIAKFAHHPLLTHFSVGIGMSTSGANFIVVGPRSYNFGTFLTYSQEYKPLKLEYYQKVKQIFDPLFTLLDTGVLNSYRDLLVNIDMILGAILSTNYN